LNEKIISYETWPDSEGEQRLMALENKVLRIIFGAQGEDFSRGWKNV
jgi:hypothetical protein